MEEEIEYLEEYEDIIKNNINTSEEESKLATSARSSNSIEKNKQSNQKDDDDGNAEGVDSSSIDSDMFEVLFSNDDDDGKSDFLTKNLTPKANASRRRTTQKDRESLDSLDALMRDYSCLVEEESPNLMLQQSEKKKPEAKSVSPSPRAQASSSKALAKDRKLTPKIPTNKATTANSQSASRAASSNSKNLPGNKASASAAAKSARQTKSSASDNAKSTTVRPKKPSYSEPAEDPLGIDDGNSSLLEQSLKELMKDQDSSDEDSGSEDEPKAPLKASPVRDKRAVKSQSDRPKISTEGLPERARIISDTILTRLDMNTLESIASDSSKDVFNRDAKPSSEPVPNTSAVASISKAIAGKIDSLFKKASKKGPSDAEDSATTSKKSTTNTNSKVNNRESKEARKAVKPLEESSKSKDLAKRESSSVRGVSSKLVDAKEKASRRDSSVSSESSQKVRKSEAPKGQEKSSRATKTESATPLSRKTKSAEELFENGKAKEKVTKPTAADKSKTMASSKFASGPTPVALISANEMSLKSLGEKTTKEHINRAKASGASGSHREEKPTDSHNKSNNKETGKGENRVDKGKKDDKQKDAGGQRAKSGAGPNEEKPKSKDPRSDAKESSAKKPRDEKPKKTPQPPIPSKQQLASKRDEKKQHPEKNPRHESSHKSFQSHRETKETDTPGIPSKSASRDASLDRLNRSTDTRQQHKTSSKTYNHSPKSSRDSSEQRSSKDKGKEAKTSEPKPPTKPASTGADEEKLETKKSEKPGQESNKSKDSKMQASSLKNSKERDVNGSDTTEKSTVASNIPTKSQQNLKENETSQRQIPNNTEHAEDPKTVSGSIVTSAAAKTASVVAAKKPIDAKSENTVDVSGSPASSFDGAKANQKNHIESSDAEAEKPPSKLENDRTKDKQDLPDEPTEKSSSAAVASNKETAIGNPVTSDITSKQQIAKEDNTKDEAPSKESPAATRETKETEETQQAKEGQQNDESASKDASATSKETKEAKDSPEAHKLKKPNESPAKAQVPGALRAPLLGKRKLASTEATLSVSPDKDLSKKFRAPVEKQSPEEDPLGGVDLANSSNDVVMVSEPSEDEKSLKQSDAKQESSSPKKACPPSLIIDKGKSMASTLTIGKIAKKSRDNGVLANSASSKEACGPTPPKRGRPTNASKLLQKREKSEICDISLRTSQLTLKSTPRKDAVGRTDKPEQNQLAPFALNQAALVADKPNAGVEQASKSSNDSAEKTKASTYKKRNEIESLKKSMAKEMLDNGINDLLTANSSSRYLTKYAAAHAAQHSETAAAAIGSPVPNAKQRMQNNSSVEFKTPPVPRRSLIAVPTTSTPLQVPAIQLGGPKKRGRKPKPLPFKLRQCRVLINRSDVANYFKRLATLGGAAEKKFATTGGRRSDVRPQGSSFSVEANKLQAKSKLTARRSSSAARFSPSSSCGAATPVNLSASGSRKRTLQATVNSHDEALEDKGNDDDDDCLLMPLKTVKTEVRKSKNEGRKSKTSTSTSGKKRKHGSSNKQATKASRATGQSKLRASLEQPAKGAVAGQRNKPATSLPEAEKLRKISRSKTSTSPAVTSSEASTSTKALGSRALVTSSTDCSSAITSGAGIAAEQLSTVEPKEEFVDEIPDAVPAAGSAATAGAKKPGSMSSVYSLSHYVGTYSSEALDASSYGIAPLALDQSGLRQYSFLHPEKYNRNHGKVSLDYCCPNLDHPMTAIDPTRVHARQNAAVREIPAYIVMTTKVVRREELDRNDGSIPAAIREKVHNLTLTNKSLAGQLPQKTPARAALPTGMARGAVQPSHSKPVIMTTQTQAANGSMSPGLGALKKQVPSSTSITPKVSGAGIAVGGVAADTSVPTRHPLAVSADRRTRMRRLEGKMRHYCAQLELLSQALRFEAIDEVLLQIELTNQEFDNATLFWDNFFDKFQQLTKMRQAPMAGNSPPSAGASATAKGSTPTEGASPPGKMQGPRRQQVQQPAVKLTDRPAKKSVEQAIHDDHGKIIGYCKVIQGNPSPLAATTTKGANSSISAAKLSTANSSGAALQGPRKSGVAKATVPVFNTSLQESPRVFYTTPRYHPRGSVTAPNSTSAAGGSVRPTRQSSGTPANLSSGKVGGIQRQQLSLQSLRRSNAAPTSTTTPKVSPASRPSLRSATLTTGMLANKSSSSILSRSLNQLSTSLENAAATVSASRPLSAGHRQEKTATKRRATPTLTNKTSGAVGLKVKSPALLANPQTLKSSINAAKSMARRARAPTPPKLSINSAESVTNQVIVVQHDSSGKPLPTNPDGAEEECILPDDNEDNQSNLNVSAHSKHSDPSSLIKSEADDDGYVDAVNQFLRKA